MTSDDLSRHVYCILGMPIDVGGMSSVLGDIEAAATSRRRLFISTPNVNFLVKMQSDPEFRESLLQSDFCSADGMPIIWIARLFGIPIKNRVAGSDIFEALKVARNFAIPLKVFLFGGAEGVAAEACRKLNAQPGGLYCVGWDCPGFGPIDGMSRSATINKINASGADFLVVSLGAKNGQSWLLRNQDRILIPVRSHLGAVLNFQAGTIRRAPRIIRTSGFEWLWRRNHIFGNVTGTMEWHSFAYCLRAFFRLWSGRGGSSWNTAVTNSIWLSRRFTVTNPLP
jgi:N-acetylglucosaminyldiphosphoundecaprenol N-acetyl-beta-D-mannosaminyltransferase